ncbi:hypothetical protein IAR50_007425 [Cryptococcus sp. DSM 104548]
MAEPPSPIRTPALAPCSSITSLLNLLQSLHSLPDRSAVPETMPTDDPIGSIPDRITATGAVDTPKMPSLSDLGHPANRDQPYPLSLVSFDIASPTKLSNALIIKPYDDITSEKMMRAFWVMKYKKGGLTMNHDF